LILETKVPTYLKEAGPEGLEISVLSQKTGVEVGKLGRVLRFLTTIHLFQEGIDKWTDAIIIYSLCFIVRKDVFANNRFSATLADSRLASTVLLLYVLQTLIRLISNNTTAMATG